MSMSKSKKHKEDGCTGRFLFYSLPSLTPILRASQSCSNLFPTNLWEGRFKSQALLNENAVLAFMAYADLHPIRTKMDATPETSRHTSIQNRTQALIKG